MFKWLKGLFAKKEEPVVEMIPPTLDPVVTVTSDEIAPVVQETVTIQVESAAPVVEKKPTRKRSTANRKKRTLVKKEEPKQPEPSPEPTVKLSPGPDKSRERQQKRLAAKKAK